MMTCREHYEYFSKILEAKNDAEFILRFNKSVDINAWNFARSAFYWAVHVELEKRNIDYSKIGDATGRLFIKYVVYLKDKKINFLIDLDYSEVERLFSNYMIENHPERMQFKPKIIEYNNDVIKYGLDGHSEIFMMKSNDLIKMTSGNNS
jgi:hypothetical protein